MASRTGQLSCVYLASLLLVSVSNVSCFQLDHSGLQCRKSAAANHCGGQDYATSWTADERQRAPRGRVTLYATTIVPPLHQNPNCENDETDVRIVMPSATMTPIVPIPMLSDSRRAPWPRRVLKHVFSRHGAASNDINNQHNSKTQVNMQSTAAAEVSTKINSNSYQPRFFVNLPGVWNRHRLIDPDQQKLRPRARIQEDFILNGFESNSPAGYFQDLVVPQPSQNPSAAVYMPAPPSVERGSPLSRVTRTGVQNLLTNLFDKWSRGQHENLRVHCDPQSNAFHLIRTGHFRCNAVVDFDRIVFGAIRMSGGRIEAKRLALNLLSFCPGLFQPVVDVNNVTLGASRGIGRRPARFPNQFDFYAHNVTFTQEDLFESNCIRNGLGRLVARILRNRGIKTPSSVHINSIKILPGTGGKIAIQGHATTVFDSDVHFEVRTGIASIGRGHIVSFPGLEISLSPNSHPLELFVPVLPTVTLDLGHNAQLLSVETVDSALQVSAKVTISPAHTCKVLGKYSQSSKSYAAQYSVDVGLWLTRVGHFSK